MSDEEQFLDAMEESIVAAESSFEPDSETDYPGHPSYMTKWRTWKETGIWPEEE